MLQNKAAEKAIELVTDAGMLDLMNVIQDSKWKIEQAIEKVAGVKISDWD